MEKSKTLKICIISVLLTAVIIVALFFTVNGMPVLKGRDGAVNVAITQNFSGKTLIFSYDEKDPEEGFMRFDTAVKIVGVLKREVFRTKETFDPEYSLTITYADGKQHNYSVNGEFVSVDGKVYKQSGKSEYDLFEKVLSGIYFEGIEEEYGK